MIFILSGKKAGRERSRPAFSLSACLTFKKPAFIYLNFRPQVPLGQLSLYLL